MWQQHRNGLSQLRSVSGLSCILKPCQRRVSHSSAATHPSLPGGTAFLINAFLTNTRRFPGTLVLRHGHTAESCCPQASGDSAPTRRNAATFLVHPDPTATFMCPTQSQEHGFQKKTVYSGQMHFASFLLLSAV